MFVLLPSLADDVLAVPLITSAVKVVGILDRLVCAVNGSTLAPAAALADVPADVETSTRISVSAMPVPPAVDTVREAVSLQADWFDLSLKLAEPLTIAAPRSGVTDKVTFFVGFFPAKTSFDASEITSDPRTVIDNGTVPAASALAIVKKPAEAISTTRNNDICFFMIFYLSGNFES